MDTKATTAPVVDDVMGPPLSPLQVMASGPIRSNPYFVISLNGSSVAARYQGVGTSCQNGCKAAAVLDPVPYAEPGAYYDTNNNLVGPQPNPFGIVSTSLYADPAHAGQWGSRVVSGVQEWGTFSQAVTLFGTTEYKYVKQM
jgi:hypothetical protein